MSAAINGGAVGYLSRRSFMKRAGMKLAGLSFAGAGVFASGRATAQTEKIRFGLTPVFLTNDLELLDAFKAYLQSQTGYQVELTLRRTYQEVTALLVSGQLDAAWICGYPFVQYHKELELVAAPDWHGKPLYQSYLITSADRAALTLTDLRSDIHAFSDPNSNSGYLVTRALLHDQGLDPNVFFRKTLFTYGHRNVIRAVASGLAQSGSVDGYVWEVMRDMEPDLVNLTKPIRKSEWLGFPPIAAKKSAAASDHIIALKHALLTLDDKPGGRRILDMLKLSGFSAHDASLYDGIAAKVKALQGVL